MLPTPWEPAVGSGALTVGGAVIVAAIFEFAGAFLAGGHVTDTVRKGMLDMSSLGREQLIYGMLASLASAGTLLIGATRFGLPISTTHAIVWRDCWLLVRFAIGIDAVNWPQVLPNFPFLDYLAPARGCHRFRHLSF